MVITRCYGKWSQCIINDFDATKGIRTPFNCEIFKEDYIMKYYQRLYSKDMLRRVILYEL